MSCVCSLAGTKACETCPNKSYVSYLQYPTTHDLASIKINLVAVPKSDFFTLILGYVRYSMGRRSTAPSTACDFVRKYVSNLNKANLEQIQREVKEELEFCEKDNKTLGDKCDHEQWSELDKWLTEEIKDLTP